MREMKDSGVSYLPSIPKDWSIRRIGTLYRESNECCGPEATADELLSVSEYYGVDYRKNRIRTTETLARAESLEGYKVCHPGDLVMNIMLAWKGAQATSDYGGIVSPSYAVFHPSSDVDPHYMHYLFRTPLFRGIFEVNSTGLIRSRLRLYPEIFLGLRTFLPPIEEQRRIAGYLDARCADIDAAIDAAEKSIDEYKRYQSAIITDAINRGFGNSSCLHESGNDFIGRVPQSWPLVQLKRVTTFLNGDRGESYPSGTDIVPQGIPFITSAELNGRYLPTTFSKHITLEKYRSLHGAKLQVGDVVFCLRGSIGKCALNLHESDGAIASSLTIARPSACEPMWLNYALSSTSVTHQAVSSSIGATSQNLAVNMLEKAYIPLPSREEQTRIAYHLDGICDAIEQSIRAKQSIIADLKAYKQSLIYEAATGKREVR